MNGRFVDNNDILLSKLEDLISRLNPLEWRYKALSRSLELAVETLKRYDGPIEPLYLDGKRPKIPGVGEKTDHYIELLVRGHSVDDVYRSVAEPPTSRQVTVYRRTASLEER